MEGEFRELRFEGVLGTSPRIYFLVTVAVTFRRRASGRVVL